MSGQARERDCADLQAREVGDDELEDVGKLEDDAGAADDLALDQMTSEAIDEAGELTVSQPAIALDHGDAVGVGGDRTVERGAEGLARPVAASAIPLGDVGGPGDHALEWRGHRALTFFTPGSSVAVVSGGWSGRAPPPGPRGGAPGLPV